MRLARALLAALLAASAPLSVAADERSTLLLPALIEEALRVNPDLRASRIRWESARAKIPLAGAWAAPKIGVEFEEIPTGSVRFNQATLMYQLIQSIPFPGKLSARKQVAVKEAQVAAMAFKQAEWEVLSQLKAVYYDLFLLDRELEVEREQVVWLRQAVQTANAGYATGQSAQAELLAFQYTVERAAASVKLSKRELLPDLETMAELRNQAIGPISSGLGELYQFEVRGENYSLMEVSDEGTRPR